MFEKTADLSRVKLPQRMTSGSVGFDLYLPDTILLAPYSSANIDLFVKVKPPPGFYFVVRPRSSTFVKYPYLVHHVGVIDLDYD